MFAVKFAICRFQPMSMPIFGPLFLIDFRAVGYDAITAALACARYFSLQGNDNLLLPPLTSDRRCWSVDRTSLSFPGLSFEHWLLRNPPEKLSDHELKTRALLLDRPQGARDGTTP